MSDTKKPSRRAFLKGSTAAVAGSTLLGGLNIARTAHAQSSDTLKAVLIGAGGRGTGAAHNFLGSNENVKIVAVADAFEDRAKGAADRIKKSFADKGKVDLPDDRIFVGFDAYQKALACDCDMVILATPPGFRPMHYSAAVGAGKHVFMEKPCCVDAPGFRQLMDANKLADDKGLKVGVGLQRHHQQSYIDGVKAIQDGELGDILFTRVYWNGGGVWTRGRQPDQTEMEYQMRNWYYFVWLCGDHICEQHVHNLDISNWIKGDHPVVANAQGGREVRKGKDNGQIFDHFFVEFTYPDGTKMFSQCRHIKNCWNSVSEYAHGTKANRSVAVRASGTNPYDQEHIDLVKAIRGDEKYNEGWYGATSSFTAVLGRMAAYSGKEVKWDEAVEKGPSEMPETYAWDATPPVVPDADGNYPVPVPGVFKPY